MLQTSNIFLYFIPAHTYTVYSLLQIGVNEKEEEDEEEEDGEKEEVLLLRVRPSKRWIMSGDKSSLVQWYSAQILICLKPKSITFDTLCSRYNIFALVLRLKINFRKKIYFQTLIDLLVIVIDINSQDLKWRY